MKKTRQTLKTHISGTAWWIQLKFGIGGVPPWENLGRKLHVFLFRECRATNTWKRHFLYSCKIHTYLLHAPGFLGHTTMCLGQPYWKCYIIAVTQPLAICLIFMSKARELSANHSAYVTTIKCVLPCPQEMY